MEVDEEEEEEKQRVTSIMEEESLSLQDMSGIHPLESYNGLVPDAVGEDNYEDDFEVSVYNCCYSVFLLLKNSSQHNSCVGDVFMGGGCMFVPVYLVVSNGISLNIDVYYIVS